MVNKVRLKLIQNISNWLISCTVLQKVGMSGV